MMNRFGLIGYPLSHSFSEGYFMEKFIRLGIADRFCYETYPLAEITDLPALLQSKPDLCGLNVTIPYKETVIPYLDELDAAAAEIGAVNTIRIKAGKLTGYNTDVSGFGESLSNFLAQNGGSSKAALILGTGGAAKAIAWTLKQLGVNYQFVSRRLKTGVLTYEMLDKAIMNKIDLIVNTTPLGMSPHIMTCPDLPYKYLDIRHRLYDLVYNPDETVFLYEGRKQGAATCNGLAMLHGQAEAAWSIWQKE